MKGRKDKNKKEENSNYNAENKLTQEDLEKEIKKYLMINKEDAEVLEPDDIKLLNVKNEERINTLKKLTTEKNSEELMRFCLSTVRKKFFKFFKFIKFKANFKNILLIHLIIKD